MLVHRMLLIVDFVNKQRTSCMVMASSRREHSWKRMSSISVLSYKPPQPLRRAALLSTMFLQVKRIYLTTFLVSHFNDGQTVTVFTSFVRKVCRGVTV